MRLGGERIAEQFQPVVIVPIECECSGPTPGVGEEMRPPAGSSACGAPADARDTDGTTAIFHSSELSYCHTGSRGRDSVGGRGRLARHACPFVVPGRSGSGHHAASGGWRCLIMASHWRNSRRFGRGSSSLASSGKTRFGRFELLDQFWRYVIAPFDTADDDQQVGMIVGMPDVEPRQTLDALVQLDAFRATRQLVSRREAWRASRLDPLRAPPLRPRLGSDSEPFQRRNDSHRDGLNPSCNAELR